MKIGAVGTTRVVGSCEVRLVDIPNDAAQEHSARDSHRPFNVATLRGTYRLRTGIPTSPVNSTIRYVISVNISINDKTPIDIRGLQYKM